LHLILTGLTVQPCFADDGFRNIFGQQQPSIQVPNEETDTLKHGRTHCGNATLVDVCKEEIQPYFDANSLNTPKLLIDLSIRRDGSPSCKVISVGSSVSDRFYCEQAIWEAAPFRYHNQYIGRVPFDRFEKNDLNRVNFVQTYFASHPRLKGKSVVMHLVPGSIRSLIKSEDDLVAIPLAKLHSKELSGFRNDWIDFLSNKQPHSKEEVLAQANKIRAKHRSLFI
jgi:hypothetical protein